MKKFKGLAGWAKAFMTLAIVSLFISFSFIGAVAEVFPELQEWSKKTFDWMAYTVDGWYGVALPDAHDWLYENVKVTAAMIGILFLVIACVLYSLAFRKAGKALTHRQNNGSVPTSTVVIGSTTESKKLIKNQAKEAKREEKMKKLAEIKAEKEAKKAAKKAAKEAAKAAKEGVDKTADAAQDAAIAKVAETVATVKANNAAASKSMDDILNSMK